MSTISHLKDQAESLGLVGSEILQFIRDQQSQEREDREKEREDKANERELEKERLRVSSDQEKMRVNQHLEEEKIELEKLRLTHAHDLELARIAAGGGNDRSTAVRVEKPRLPSYKDGEDMPAYLVRFERVCDLLELSRDSLAVRLGSLLSGKAAEIYSSLTPNVTGDYDRLKEAILKAYNKTYDTYRSEFRTSRIDSNVSYVQFVTTLGQKLDFWIESSKITKSYENLREFIVLDQLLAGVPAELRLFLKERGTMSLEDTANCADNWASAHYGVKKSFHAEPASSRRNFSNRGDFSNKGTPEKYSSQLFGSKQTDLPRSTNSKGNAQNITCHNCGSKGHFKSNCPGMTRVKTDPGRSENVHSVRVCLEEKISPKYMSCGTINGSNVSTILRDTGCTCVIVACDVFPNLDTTKLSKVDLSDYLGRITKFPMVKCYLKCDFYDGWVDAILAPIKCCSVIVGNIPGVRDRREEVISSVSHNITEGSARVDNHEVSLAVTRAESKRSNVPHPLKLPKINSLTLTPEDFSVKQKSCKTLSTPWHKAREGDISTLKDGSKFKFVVKDTLLYRECMHSPNPSIIGRKSLVLPVECRALVLHTAHENPIAGHFSHNKTMSKIASDFYWPGAALDVRTYCRSCDVCQRMSQKRTKPVPLVKMPIIDTPFSRISMDIVGPLTPMSADGHRYILTVIDWATGFPEAVALKSIDSISVSEALLAIFSRVGIPHTILSDQGTNFTSKLMGELHRLLGVQPIFSSIYHAQGNGRQERLHSTLKSSLKKLCIDKPRDWHRYLVATLFALRELPSDRSGFSAFELLYGRKVRGPIRVLKDLWVDKEASDDQRDSFQYIIDLRSKLENCAKLALENSKLSQKSFSTYFDLKAKDRSLTVGDEALILLPDSSNKLLMSWKGPYPVVKRLNKVNYVLDCGNRTKVFHINLLKRYVRRATVSNTSIISEHVANISVVPSNVFFVAHAVVIDESALFMTSGELEKTKIDLVREPCLDVGPLSTSIPSINPSISEDLSSQQRVDINNLLTEFDDVLSDLPGHTTTVTHTINLMTAAPVRSRVYPVPVHLRRVFDEEVDELLKLGIIQRSESDFCSPVVLIRKADSSYRLAIDYRTLNSFSKFDAEPSFNIDEDLHKFSGSKFYSEIDITKAYHQVELDRKSRPLTAFPTSRGLMEYTRLPFGLLTACATYARLMRIVLADLSGVTFYFDNILIYSRTWEAHLSVLRKVFERLRSHGLTAQPKKCNFGYVSINYLGFVISQDLLSPQKPKIEAMCLAEPPESKKCLRSFLGFISFYRKFIPNLATVTAPLTDMLKKDVKEPLSYSVDQLSCFKKIKCFFSSQPVLRLPDVNLPFVVRTDGSGFGIGAVLLQYYDNTPFPVSYASRKLTTSEVKFSTVERECLAIVFAIQKFSVYLLGKPFLLEVDHRPLVYLNKMKNLNSRLARWSLCLQPYNYTIVYLPGSENVGADYLSRS